MARDHGAVVSLVVGLVWMVEAFFDARQDNRDRCSRAGGRRQFQDPLHPAGRRTRGRRFQRRHLPLPGERGPDRRGRGNTFRFAELPAGLRLG